MEQSSCEGDGLRRAQAGELTSFTVICCDSFGNRQTAGGDDISVQVSSAEGDKQSSVAGSVADMGRGVYKVHKGNLALHSAHHGPLQCRSLGLNSHLGGYNSMSVPYYHLSSVHSVWVAGTIDHMSRG